VQNVALSWQQSAVLSGALLAGAAGLYATRSERARRLVPYAREIGVIAALYAMWQLAGELSVLGTSGAYARARWIERFEHDVFLPSESALQHHLVHHSWLVQACNLYYATMHFGALFAFLLWLFLRHRDAYPSIRLTIVLITAVCLAIQLLPVAPPRLLSGYVDTAKQYGQSVYGLGIAPDQLSAMPSLHVGWAVLIGWAVWRLGSGPLRYAGWVHTAVTAFVVVATANHFWLDGIVAVLLLVACIAAQRVTRYYYERYKAAREQTATAPALADAVV
jgi:hypothetical protein